MDHRSGGCQHRVADRNRAAVPLKSPGVGHKVEVPARSGAVGKRNNKIVALLDHSNRCCISPAIAAAGDLDDRKDAVTASRSAERGDQAIGEALVAGAFGVDDRLITPTHARGDTNPSDDHDGHKKRQQHNNTAPHTRFTDATGFPLAVEAFEGNKAETATMLAVINAFKTAHQLTDVTVVADAGMISEANQIALQASGLSFILGTRIPFVPDVVREWRDTHPDQAIPDGQMFTQPWPASSSEKARGIPDRVVYYQHRHDRARRTLRGIDEQVAKAERAVDGHAPVKRNRFIKLTGASKSVNRDLEAKARGLAGLKGYTTNLTTVTPEFVIDAYHQLWRIEKSFRMSKHDLQARPVYHHKRESIEAHLTIVFAALAVSHFIEHQTGWSIKKFVPHRTPLPHRPHQGRQTNADRRRPATRRPTRSAQHDQHRPTTLKCPKSGPAQRGSWKAVLPSYSKNSPR
jgi:Transposase DDE domain